MESTLSAFSSASYNREFQSGVLVHLMWSDDLAKAAAENMTLEDFEIPIHRVVFEAFLNYWARFQTRPPLDLLRQEVLNVTGNVDGKALTVIQEDEHPALSSLMMNIFSPLGKNPDYYLAALPQFLITARAQRVIDDLDLDSRQLRPEDPSRIIEEITRIQRQAEAISAPEQFVSIMDDTGMVETAEEIEAIPTGISKLDRILSGGPVIGDLGMLIAIPGKGKTNTLLSFGVAAASYGFDALFISLELRGDNPRRRATAMLSGLPGDRIKLPRESLTPEERTRLAYLGDSALFPAADRLMTRDFSDEKVSPEKLIRTIAGWKEEVARRRGSDESCKLVLIDWLDCLDFGYQRGRSEWAIIPEALRTIKLAMNRFGVVGWTATQGNKDAVGRVLVGLSDTAGGFQKNAPVDISIGLGNTQQQIEATRAGLDDDLFVEGDDGAEITFNVCKNRNGGLGHFKVFRAPTLRLYDTSDDYYRHRNLILSDHMTPQNVAQITGWSGRTEDNVMAQLGDGNVS